MRQACAQHGLITRFIGDRIAFSPPLIITDAEIDDMVDGVAKALDELTAQLRRERIPPIG